MAKESFTFDDLRSWVREGNIAPVYLLYGEEDFLVDEAVQLLIDTVVPSKERGFNLDVLHANDADARDVISRASSFPMMAERRVVVLRDADRATVKDLELLAHYVEHPSSSTCFVMVAEKPDFRKRPFSSVKRAGTAVGFKPLYENQIPAWIADHIRRRGLTIAPGASKLLAAYVGTSLREVKNEIDKLLVYLNDRTSIAEDDVVAVVGVSKEFTVFELQKAVGGKDLRRSLNILDHMLNAGESVPFIIVMLSGYFVTLWKLHDLRRRGVPEKEQVAALRINPYFMKDYHDVLGKYSGAEIERIFSLLAVADEKTKSSSTDSKQVMVTLLLQIQDAEGTSVNG